MVCALGDHTELALSEVSAKPPALSGRARLKSQEEAVSGRYDGVPQLLSSTHTGKAGGCRAYTIKCLQRKATGYMVVQDFRSASTRPCSAEYLSAHRQPTGKHIWTSLVVQWLRICLPMPMQVTRVRFLFRKIPYTTSN